MINVKIGYCRNSRERISKLDKGSGGRIRRVEDSGKGIVVIKGSHMYIQEGVKAITGKGGWCRWSKGDRLCREGVGARGVRQT